MRSLIFSLLLAGSYAINFKLSQAAMIRPEGEGGEGGVTAGSDENRASEDVRKNFREITRRVKNGEGIEDEAEEVPSLTREK